MENSLTTHQGRFEEQKDENMYAAGQVNGGLARQQQDMALRKKTDQQAGDGMQLEIDKFLATQDMLDNDDNDDKQPRRQTIFQAERQNTNNYLATLTQQGTDEGDA